jgi:RNA polymerase sigma-70 factor (sigma-E family)
MPDDAAFERFVRQHTATLHRTAFLLTGNRYSAEELLQDTLTRLYPKWQKVLDADAGLAYVRRSLVNRFVSGARSPAARAESMWELPDSWDGRDVSETVATANTIWQLLGGLPPRQRAAVVMRYFHDMSDPDIADVLGCRPVSVRSLVSRGISAMRTAYLPTASAEGSPR